MTAPEHPDVPILVYAPGLGQTAENSAGRVAEVIATLVDRRRVGTVSTSVETKVTAPRGLRVGKTVLAKDDTPILRVFELDYRARLDTSSSAAGPPASPGVFRSSAFALFGMVRLIKALPQAAKSPMAKLQLAYGLIAVLALMVSAAVAIVAGLVAAGVSMPDWIDSLFGEHAAAWSIGIGGTVVLTWAATRKALLAVAVSTQRLVRYVWNENRLGDTVALTVDDAVNGLRDNGWTGDIHLLGYSFGSLVLFDALFPKVTSLRAPDEVLSVRSLTTLGCPLDVVRMFHPEYVTNREARAPDAPWRNVFIATDVCGSNLLDSDDKAESTSAAEPKAFVIDGVTPVSTRYLDEELTFWSVLRIKGFRTHAGYWGSARDSSCFDVLIEQWLATDRDHLTRTGTGPQE